MFGIQMEVTEIKITYDHVGFGTIVTPILSTPRPETLLPSFDDFANDGEDRQ